MLQTNATCIRIVPVMVRNNGEEGLRGQLIRKMSAHIHTDIFRIQRREDFLLRAQRVVKLEFQQFALLLAGRSYRIFTKYTEKERPRQLLC